jgi:hypothetical protein
MSKSLSPKQLETLRAYARDAEPLDLYDYTTSGSLAWHNRERTIESLKRRGLLDDDQRITDAGRAALNS